MSIDNPIHTVATDHVAKAEFSFRGAAEIVASTDPVACKNATGFDLAKLIESANAVAKSGGTMAKAGAIAAISGAVATGGLLSPETGIAAGCAAMAAVASHGLGGSAKGKNTRT